MKIHPPQVPPPPHLPLNSDIAISLAIAHTLWVQDFEYHDQLGRDPYQQFHIWTLPPQSRIPAVKNLLTKYTKSKHRRHLLYTASLRGDEDIVRVLLDTGVSVHPDTSLPVDLYDREDLVLGEDAEEKGSRAGFVADIADPTILPVHAAANAGHLGVLKLLLETGVDVDVRDDMGRTALVAAAQGGNLDVMSWLIERGADVCKKTNDDEYARGLLGWLAGAGALEMVCTHDDIQGVRIVLEAAEGRRKGGARGLVTPLAVKAAVVGGFEGLKLVLDKGGYPSVEKGKVLGELNESQIKVLSEVLLWAAQCGSLECLKLLLKYLYPCGETGEPLAFEIPEELQQNLAYGAYDAMHNNQPDKFEFIYSLGITENETSSVDGVPEGQRFNVQHLMEEAILMGSMDCLRLLIEKYGAQPNQDRVNPRMQPLYIAAEYDQTEMVRFLLEKYSPDIHLGSGRYASGPTALWIAIALKSFGSIELLLRHGGPLDFIDDDILNTNQPRDVFLRASLDDLNRPIVRLEIWSPEEIDFAATKADFQDRNPHWVRIGIGPEDLDWIRDLQYRKSDEELREEGDGARALDEQEEAELNLDENDIRRRLTALPTAEKRERELSKDDDLLPEWRPWAVPASNDD